MCYFCCAWNSLLPLVKQALNAAASPNARDDAVTLARNQKYIHVVSCNRMIQELDFLNKKIITQRGVCFFSLQNIKFQQNDYTLQKFRKYFKKFLHGMITLPSCHILPSFSQLWNPLRLQSRRHKNRAHLNPMAIDKN